MKQRTEEWVQKAEGDWRIAQRELESQEPVWDGICFHAQPTVRREVFEGDPGETRGGGPEDP